MSAVAGILEFADRKHRVVIVARDDGAFRLVPQTWLRNVHEGRFVSEGWASLPELEPIFESVAIAEREARKEFRCWI
jgi:hypothetical protein